MTFETGHRGINYSVKLPKNAGWRLDYFLVTKDILDKVKASEILTDCYGSDHCPVMLDIDL